MKFLFLAAISLTLLSPRAQAGAVDDSINCIAGGKLSCGNGINSARETEKVEKVKSDSEEKVRTETAEVET